MMADAKSAETAELAMVTRAAIAGIGADAPSSDWDLRPHDHATQLGPDAEALRAVLTSDAAQAIMAHFTDKDAEAVHAQKLYKRWSHRAIVLRFIATGAGAMFLLLGAADDPLALGALGFGIALQYLCLFLAIVITGYLALAKPFETWMTARAEAELARLALFDHVLAAEPRGMPLPTAGQTPPLPYLPLALEYFRRYQFDVQKRYYAERGAQHRKAAGLTRGRQIALQLLGVVTLAPIGLVAASWLGYAAVDGLFVHKAGLAAGVIIAGGLTLLAARSAISLDRRNAARYAVTHANLTDLEAQGLPAARLAAAEGRRADVLAFTSGVQRLMAAEHQEWVLLREHMARPEQGGAIAADPVPLAIPG